MNPQEEFAKFLAEISFEFPESYNDVITLGLTNIKPWYFLSSEDIPSAFVDVNAMYPAQTVVPFARRQDNDDYACFLIKEDNHLINFGPVVIIHLWASPGWERRNEYANFWGWFCDAIGTMIWFHTPNDYSEEEDVESYESYNLPTAHIAAITEGLVDAEAGRYRDGHQILEETKMRFAPKPEVGSGKQFRAASGKVQALGESPRAALDALLAHNSGDFVTPIVISPSNQGDTFFSDEQQARMQALKARRETIDLLHKGCIVSSCSMLP